MTVPYNLTLCKTPEYLLKLQNVLWKTEKPADGTMDEERFKEIKGTGLSIDKWLKMPHGPKLEAILKKRAIEGLTEDEQGFKNPEEAQQHLCLIAPAVKEESPKEKIEFADAPRDLRDLMESRMVKIPGGDFMMGEKEKRRKVEVEPFYMDKFPVTQKLYKEITGDEPSYFKGDDNPVEQVSWYDAVNFCNALSKKMGLKDAYQIDGETVTQATDGDGFRLPTEAEWEYACRAKATGDHYGNLDEIAWYEKKFRKNDPSGRAEKGKWIRSL